MSHPATVVYVMIASPSDVREARDAVHKALDRWNESNTSMRKVALVPIRWETSAVPMLGNSPQAIINKQLVDKADIVIALFGSKLGTVTPAAVSGTAEEIDQAETDGKPIHLYFSTAPLANDVDPDQLKALRAFQAELEQRGLYGTFGSTEELTAHVWQAIEHDLALLDLTEATAPARTAGVDFFAQPGMERLPETDSKGRLKYKTSRWVELTNRGELDAEDVMVSANDGVFLGGAGTTVIHAGQTRRYSMMLTMGADDPVMTVTWSEGGVSHSKELHVG